MNCFTIRKPIFLALSVVCHTGRRRPFAKEEPKKFLLFFGCSNEWLASKKNVLGACHQPRLKSQVPETLKQLLQPWSDPILCLSLGVHQHLNSRDLSSNHHLAFFFFRASLSSPGWPGTYRGPPTSSPCVLGFTVCSQPFLTPDFGFLRQSLTV